MKNNKILFIASLMAMLAAVSQAEARAAVRPVDAAELSATTKTKGKVNKVKVGYSFDHFAENAKVSRLFVSDEMLATMHSAGQLKSSHWNFDRIVQRMTSLLSLHTHSRSTTLVFRKDYNEVLKEKDYEQLYYLRDGNIQMVVFGIRAGGKKLKEILIFRFRDNYCSRVVQLTGDLNTDDIPVLLKLRK